MPPFLLLLLVATSTPASAEASTAPVAESDASARPQPLPPRVRERTPPTPHETVAPAAEPETTRHVGVHVGVNVGLFAVDVQAGRFYAMLAGNAGIPLLTNGSFGAFSGLVGYSVPLKRSRRSQWKLDMNLHLQGGFTADYLYNALATGPNRIDYGHIGGGVVLGFRYEHDSGFSMGFRAPLFGYSFSRANRALSSGVSLYYLGAAVSLPVVSFGYRF